MTLNDLIDEIATLHPDQIALVSDSGSWTFAELQSRVIQAAAAFHGRGIRKGDCAAVILRNCPEFIVAYFGLARLGAAVVPVNFMVQKSEELRYMLADCGAAGVVTQEEFLRGILAAKTSLPRLRSVWTIDSPSRREGVEDFGEFVESADPKIRPAADVYGGDVAAILYTSGTTGSPKGVMLTHANLVSNSEASVEVMRITGRDVFLTLLPMFHTFAWTACVLVSLRAGCKNILVRSVTPAAPWLRRMGRHGVTLFAAVPSLYSVLAKEARGAQRWFLRLWSFRKVRFCISGAAPLSPSVAEAFSSALGIEILEGYGLTETSPVAAINPPQRNVPGSVGPPLPGVRLKILREDGSEQPIGGEGEIGIRGPNVMLGYYRNPEATRGTFTHDGYLKTGDIGVVDTLGYLRLRDRKKDMIIIKGLKVFSAQVEAALSEHPDVDEAAVIGIPGPDADEVIKAFVTLRPGAAADKAALMKFAREKLDPYKRPRDIEIVESLPKNALQKVLKRVLRQQEIAKIK